MVRTITAGGIAAFRTERETQASMTQNQLIARRRWLIAVSLIVLGLLAVSRFGSQKPTADKPCILSWKTQPGTIFVTAIDPVNRCSVDTSGAPDSQHVILGYGNMLTGMSLGTLRAFIREQQRIRYGNENGIPERDQ